MAEHNIAIGIIVLHCRLVIEMAMVVKKAFFHYRKRLYVFVFPPPPETEANDYESSTHFKAIKLSNNRLSYSQNQILFPISL
jgi:hypothetical protein